jgi:hypothetical protein
LEWKRDLIVTFLSSKEKENNWEDLKINKMAQSTLEKLPYQTPRIRVIFLN